MSSHPPGDKLALPEHPNLRHLKDQAADLLSAGRATSVSDAQLQIARAYGFASWPKLKAHVESTAEVAELKRAIDANDLELVKAMTTANPALHEAPIGYGKDGPLTWVAACRVPWESVNVESLGWLLDHGADPNCGDAARWRSSSYSEPGTALALGRRKYNS